MKTSKCLEAGHYNGDNTFVKAELEVYVVFQYSRVYQDLKGFSKNGENFCKQLRFVLQQRYVGLAAISNGEHLQLELLRRLEKSATKMTKEDEDYYQKNISGYETRLTWETALENSYQAMEEISSLILHMKLAVAARRERCTLAVMQLILEDCKAARTKTDSCTKDLICSINRTFHLWLVVPKVWSLICLLPLTAGILFQSILDLAKERMQLLCNVLNTYNQHLSSFGQNLIDCHTQIHSAVSQVDAEKDIQSLLEEKSVSSPETKSEFLLMDYYVSTAQGRQLCLDSLERMLKTYTETSFSDVKNQKDTAVLLEQTSRKTSLLQANICKLSTVLAELEQKPKPTHPWSNCISNKEKVKQLM
ncbi:LOW QUALITY PROTEIN: nostrin [Macrochelys suwanniensis]